MFVLRAAGSTLLIYALFNAAFGLPAREILFVSSNGWDAIGATWFGYTTLWVNRAGAPLEQLDPAQFQQVHRAVVVNLHAVSHVTPGLNEKADLHFKHRAEVLPVSRSYLTALEEAGLLPPLSHPVVCATRCRAGQR